MVEQAVAWSFFGLMLIFIIFGVVWGVFRGFKKTVVRGLWLVATAVLLFFTVGLIVDGVLAANLPILNLTYNGKSFNTIQGFLTEYIVVFLKAENTAENMLAVTNLLRLTKLFINAILFSLLFVMFKYLFYPLYSLIYKWLFRSKKEKAYAQEIKQYKKALKEYNQKTKNMTKVKGHGFSNDQTEYEENLQELKPPASSSSMSLLAQLKNHVQNPPNNQAANNPINNATNAQEEKEFVPQDEYNPLKKDKKKEKPYIEKPLKPKKPKKRRFLGACAGAIVGLFSCAMIINPLIGVMDILVEANNYSMSQISESNSDDGLITAIIKDLANGDQEQEKHALDILKYYKQSASAGTLKILGVHPLSAFTFNELASTKLNGTKVYLKNELFLFLDIAVDALQVVQHFNDFKEHQTLAKTNTLLDMSKNLVNKTFDLQLVQALGTDFLPILKAFAVNTINEINTEAINNAVFKDMLLTSVDAMLGSTSSTANMSAIQNDLITFINVLKDLNKEIIIDDAPTQKSMLTILMANDFASDKELVIKFLTTKDQVKNIFESLLNTKSVSSILPHATYLLLDYVSNLESINIDMPNDINDFLNLELKQAIINIVDESINLIAEIDFTKNISIESFSKTTIITIGEILNITKTSLLPNETYQALIAKLTEVLEEQIASITMGNLNLSKAIHGMVGNIKQVQNWKTESLVIAEFFDGLFVTANNNPPIIDVSSELALSDIDFKAVGKKIEKLFSSVIFGGVYKSTSDNSFDGFFKNNTATTIDILMAQVLDSLAATFITDDNELAYSMGELIQQKISPRIMAGEVTSYEKELDNLMHLASLQELDLDLESNLDGAFKEIGSTIDSFITRQSTLILESDLKELFINIIASIKDDLIAQLDNEILKDALNKSIGSTNESDTDSILYNLKYKDIISYEWELSHLANLLKISDFSLDGLSGIGKTFDEIAYNYKEHMGNYVDDTNKNSLLISKNNIKSLVNAFIENMYEENSNEMESLISEIKENINTLDESFNYAGVRFSWEREFDYISKLSNLDVGEDILSDIDAVADVGKTFDDIAFKENYNSILITKNMLSNLVIDILENAKTENEEINEIVEDLQNKIQDYIDLDDYPANFSYEIELVNIMQLLDLDIENIDDFLGYLVLEEDGEAYGLYTDKGIILPENTNGKGLVLDDIVNNANYSSHIISKDLINKLLTVILDQTINETLSGNYFEIANSIIQKLDKDNASYVDIEVYEKEFNSLKYLLDIKKYANVSIDATDQLATLGTYFDHIASAKLVDDAGKQLLATMIDEIAAHETTSEIVTNINQAVSEFTSTNSSIINVFKDNIVALNYNENNYESQYLALGNMLDSMQNISTNINNIKSNIHEAKESMYNLSQLLDELQKSIVSSNLGALYVNVYIYTFLETELSDSFELLDENFKNYFTSYGNQLIIDLEENNKLLYWEMDMDATGYNISEGFDPDNITSNDFDYALIKIINAL